MKTEFLKEFGLEKEAIDKIMAENGKDVNAVKETLATVQGELDKVKPQLDEANKTIEKFGDYEDTKQAAEDWKKKFEENEASHAEKLAEIELQKKIDEVLVGAKHPELLKNAFKLKELKESKNFDSDFKAQADEIKEKYKDNWESGEPIKNPVGKSDNKGIHTTNPWLKETFNLTEQGKLLKENPELAKQFMKQK